MADYAARRFKFNKTRYMPGDEVKGLKASDRKMLTDRGLLVTRISDEDQKAAKAYQERVIAAEAKVEAAQGVLADAEKAIKDAKTEADTKAAEKQKADAEKALAEAEKALKALKG